MIAPMDRPTSVDATSRIARSSSPAASGGGTYASSIARSARFWATISGRPAFKIVYSTESAPNAVTGKQVKLVVDRYYLWKGGRRAVVDLGTPQGVDNVDAYRLMIESFRWS